MKILNVLGNLKDLIKINFNLKLLTFTYQDNRQINLENKESKTIFTKKQRSKGMLKNK